MSPIKVKKINTYTNYTFFLDLHSAKQFFWLIVFQTFTLQELRK